jgi:hypothetical protein
MCDPISLGTLAVTSTGLDVYQAQGANKVSKAQRDIAFRQGHQQQAQLDTRALQERAAAAQTSEQIRRESLEALGSSRARAAEQGGGGRSFEDVINEGMAKEARTKSTVAQNLAATEDQIAYQKTSVQTGLELSRPIMPFDYLGSALQIGMAGFGGYVSGKQYQAL